MTVPILPRRQASDGLRLETPFHAPVLRTPRLTLRPHRLGDAPQWYAIQSDPEVLRFIPWPRRDALASRRHLLQRTRRTVLRKRHDFLALAVEHDGVLIGDIGVHLRDVPAATRTAEISWIIDRRHARHGYAREATSAALEALVTRLGARTITARIDEGNERSITMARRLSFRPTRPGMFVTTADRVVGLAQLTP